jgi:choline dehydrogenase
MKVERSDYVIVGAGSAGCVLAARLSADPGVRVVLLEAGGPDTRREIRIPAAFSRLFKTDFDWAYETEPQARLDGRRLYWPRGKGVGGSGSMNAMLYVRGHRDDYDGWAKADNPGWGYWDVLPYFRRAERQARGASEYHGDDGPQRVADQRSVNPLSRAFVEAGVECGFPHNPDFNGAQQDGVGLYQVTQHRGARWSAADAYLRPALTRPNLTVITGAHVTRVRFEGTRAVGVDYVAGAQARTARAEREVILSGGAINSPQVLLLSGVGPADDLRGLGIEVVSDLPGVGANLQDHLATGVAFACPRAISLANAETLRGLLGYLLLRRGPLTSCIAEAGGFVRTRPELARPDLQFHFAPVYFIDHGFARPPGHGFTVGPTLLRPGARGRVSLRSADPLVPPAIQANYLAGERDLATLVAGVRLARRLAHARAFDPFRGAEILPGAAAADDAAIAAHVRATAQTLYHPVGTCRMGADARAVVDARLRVHGVEGLRVVDASIMPTIVGGNTNAPTIMIAEKAADLIRSG